MSTELSKLRSTLEADGFREIPEHPKRADLHVGVRVRNAGEQYDTAVFKGTAVVVAILRKGTDEHPDAWERDWGRPNIEVIVERDEGYVKRGYPRHTNWSDYGTSVALDQPQGALNV